MTILLRLSDDATLFEVCYIGEIDHRVRVRAIHEMQHRLRDGWVKQLLIDFTRSQPTSPVDDEHADAVREAWMSSTFPRGARIALLNPPDDYEDPMQQAGAAGHFVIRRFHDRATALAWLKGTL
ncbi:hypothetical protein LF41_2286 [Lysobacter dokdonensis DS-58]|uniref:STAS/SEC14 domain-containing protein n=1 Tax=Lysobacter dokdonensis DS-58 TaxID=1300345 RepID=A0A0A2X3H9_9GAMM|nr:hypothetical protein [Lysobacter dokdonensis]KGQ19784.1 hypothetical protein LF41_2286 [Lysobacter dokdonensis DS-58]